jgi:hypothetical protein
MLVLEPIFEADLPPEIYDVFLWGIDIRHVRRPNPIDRRCPRRPEILLRRYTRLFHHMNRRERKGIRLRLRPN